MSVIQLDDEVARLLADAAARQGVDPGDLALEAIKAYLEPKRRSLSFVALGDGSPGFRAADAEDVLSAEFGRARR